MTSPTEDAMRTYELKRDGEKPLVFDGVLLGQGSSARRGGPPRWFEAAIYRTEGGTYVVSGIGRSEVDGETDRCWAVTCDDPRAVVATLTRTDDDGVKYITRTASDALSEAGRKDTGIREAFLQRVA